MFKIPTVDEIENKQKEKQNSSHQDTLSRFRSHQQQQTKEQLNIPQNSNSNNNNNNGNDINHTLQQTTSYSIETTLNNTSNGYHNRHVDTNTNSKKVAQLTHIQVHPCQRGNAILNHVRNVPWEYNEDVLPDYQVGKTSCILFLSLKYNRLHPEYLFSRIKKIGHNYILRMVLCTVDIDDYESTIKELTWMCFMNHFTLVLAWSAEEAGRYIETFKAYENKPPDMIMEKIDDDYLSKLTNTLTNIKTINKTDVVTLSSTFGSLFEMMNASSEELLLCPGFGNQKVTRFKKAFDEPFFLNKD